MKALKILAVAAVAVCCIETANAQVVVRARIGTPPPRHRVVVVQRPVHHRPYHRSYHRHYVRHPHRY